MNESDPRIEEAKAAVEETESKAGKDSLETSYKLDELAAILKESGHLLDAANATARAKSIRAKCFANESKRQEEQIGEVSAGKDLSATGWLKVLYRFALGACSVILAIAIFLPSVTVGGMLTREIIGSLAAATLLQLILFPIKSIPRFLKYIIVLVASGGIWTVLSNL